MSVFNSPKIEVFVGATGSGKGVSVNRRLAELKPRRLLIWDPRNEYGKHAPAYSKIWELFGAFKHAKGGAVRARFVPDGRIDLDEAFAFVCRLAFEDQKKREARGLEPEALVMMAEELSDVTKPSYAPPDWRRCITQGRHVGLHILAATQRPALIDKTILSAATVVRCFMLGYDADVKVMATELRAKPEEIEALFTQEVGEGEAKETTIHYMERLRRTRETVQGQIVIKGAKFAEKRQAKGPDGATSTTKKRGAT